MRTVRRLASAAAVALLLGFGASSGVRGEEPKAWERVEYRRNGGTDAEVASVALTSACDAEVVPRTGAAAVRGTWTRVGLKVPSLRFVGPDQAVQVFRIVPEGLEEGIDAAIGARLRPVDGYTWHARASSTTDAPVLRGERFTSGRETLVLYSDGGADWIGRSEGGRAPIVAGEKKLLADGSMLLSLPGGVTCRFRRDADAWKDAETGSVFEPLAEVESREVCLANLKKIAETFAEMSRGRGGGKPAYDGTALLLSWRARGTLPGPDATALLRCPADRALRALDAAGRAAYDDADTKNPPGDLCSYVARNFTQHPLDSEGKQREAIACDRQGPDGRTPHHKGGICVAFDDGTAAFLTREELGIAPDAPIVVGPDSDCRLLRPLVFKR